MLAHEAHHRGQVCMLAHQLGFPLPNEVKVGFVSGFVADDLPAASYNEGPASAIIASSGTGRSGAISKLA